MLPGAAHLRAVPLLVRPWTRLHTCNRRWRQVLGPREMMLFAMPRLSLVFKLDVVRPTYIASYLIPFPLTDLVPRPCVIRSFSLVPAYSFNNSIA
jgi:hypothetical protein